MSKLTDQLLKDCREIAAQRIAERVRANHPDAKVTVKDSLVTISGTDGVKQEYGDGNTEPRPWVKEAIGGV